MSGATSRLGGSRTRPVIGQQGLRGARPLVELAQGLHHARRLVVPGAFGAAIDAPLRTQGVMAPLAERINVGRPTLGICLGLHGSGGSDESAGRQEPGSVALQAVGFNDSLVTPQMG